MENAKLSRFSNFNTMLFASKVQFTIIGDSCLTYQEIGFIENLDRYAKLGDYSKFGYYVRAVEIVPKNSDILIEVQSQLNFLCCNV